MGMDFTVKIFDSTTGLNRTAAYTKRSLKLFLKPCGLL
jgi:hypothetical protein